MKLRERCWSCGRRGWVWTFEVYRSSVLCRDVDACRKRDKRNVLR